MARRFGNKVGMVAAFDAGAWLSGMARSKGLASGVSLAVVGAVLWPARQNWRSLPQDGFPFSYYPMFSARRGGTSSVTCVLGVDADGGRHAVHYRYAGFGGLNQVRRQLRRMAIEGRADETCAFVIANLARERPALLAKYAAVQLVTRTYRLDDFFGGKSKEPFRQKVHGTVLLTGTTVLAIDPALVSDPAVVLHAGPA